ncbi:MAG: hypothetical protein JW804_04070 [Sedimentisphaerales bacterium]|nr:hypothetical protein [Sedimentisphaerales bacterium]
MKTQLKVRKADSSIERYMHTKVMHTISQALAEVSKSEMSVIENLAEVVTYFLYSRHKECEIASSEILSAIKVSLAATGYEDAAEALSRHHFNRRLGRGRIEVLNLNVNQVSDLSTMFLFQDSYERLQWDKSVIVDDLVNKHGLARQSARTVAYMVEEKVLNLGLTQIPKSYVKQIVLSDTAAVMRAETQLQTA